MLKNIICAKCKVHWIFDDAVSKACPNCGGKVSYHRRPNGQSIRIVTVWDDKPKDIEVTPTS